MKTGINILCKAKKGQFLITKKPFCDIDGKNRYELQWNNNIFIPLDPNIQHQIIVKFPYMGRECCPGNFSVQIQPCEIHSYMYSVPMMMTSKGKIAFTGSQMSNSTPPTDSKTANKCLSCGAEVLENATFCIKCGAKIEEKINSLIINFSRINIKTCLGKFHFNKIFCIFPNLKMI